MDSVTLSISEYSELRFFILQTRNAVISSCPHRRLSKADRERLFVLASASLEGALRTLEQPVLKGVVNV